MGILISILVLIAGVIVGSILVYASYRMYKLIDKVESKCTDCHQNCQQGRYCTELDHKNP